MRPFELSRQPFARLIRPHSLQRHLALLLGEPLGIFDARVEEEVDDGSSDDRDQTDENEEALPWFQDVGRGFAQGIAEYGGNDLVYQLRSHRSARARNERHTWPTPLVEYHAHTRRGCSSRRYQRAVKTPNKGTQPASKRPRKKRDAASVLKLPRSAICCSFCQYDG
jgi:hypothetical protein